MYSLGLIIGALGLQKDGRNRYSMWGFAAALVILGALAVATFSSIAEFRQRMEAVTRSHDIMAKSRYAISMAKDAVLGERAFIITGQEQYADIYVAAAKALPQQTAAIKATMRQPDKRQWLALLEAVTAEIIAESDAAIAQKRAGKSAEGAMDANLEHLAKLREVDREMKEEEELLLAQRQQESEASASRMAAVIAVGMTVSFALLIVTFAGLRRENTARLRAEEELRKANEELELRVAERTAQLFDANLRLGEELAENQRVRAEVEDLNKNLEQRVTERTAQLEAANKELESFSYSVSHDLRAPLRAMEGFSRTLEEDYAGTLDGEGLRVVGVIRDRSQKMSRMVDDLLQFSRLGRQGISFAKVDMQALANEVWHDLMLNPGERQPQFVLHALTPAIGDRAMLRHVWDNLLSNAVKFSGAKENPVIEVGCRREGNEIVYSVEDNGAGFDMQYCNKLFGVFQRLHGVQEFPGTGVGLAIVQRVVTRHGGRVWAEGKVGEGAAFHFALPAEEEHE